MEDLKTIIIESFYTQPIMLLTAVVATLVGFLKRNKFPELRLMPFYPLASFIQGVVAYIIIACWRDEHYQADSISESIFILIEFLIIHDFFRKVITIKNLKTYIQLIFFFYLAYLISMWSFTDTFYRYAVKVYLLETLSILFFCFIYLFQLFKLPPKEDLLNSPPFWVAIGCLFYFSCTIPLFLIDSILDAFPRHHNFYSINFLAYTILFSFIIKAFSCNPATTK